MIPHPPPKKKPRPCKMNRACWKYCSVSVVGSRMIMLLLMPRFKRGIPEAAPCVDLVQLFPDVNEQKVAPVEFSQQFFDKAHVRKFFVPFHIVP